MAGIGIVIIDDAKDFLGELAPAVVVINVQAVTAGILVQSRIRLSAGLVASSPTGALLSVGTDGQHIGALEVTMGEGRSRMRR